MLLQLRWLSFYCFHCGPLQSLKMYSWHPLLIRSWHSEVRKHELHSLHPLIWLVKKVMREAKTASFTVRLVTIGNKHQKQTPPPISKLHSTNIASRQLPFTRILRWWSLLRRSPFLMRPLQTPLNKYRLAINTNPPLMKFSKKVVASDATSLNPTQQITTRHSHKSSAHEVF